MHLMGCAVGTLAQFLPVLSIMIMFIVYAVVNGSLDPVVVSSSLATLYVLRVPTNWLPVSLSLAADAFQSIKRIEDFLLAEEVQAQPDITLAPAVKLSNASFTWESPPANEEGESRKDEEKKNRMSRAMRRQRAGHEKKGIETSGTERSELVGIIGSVGSGKMSLLSALAGDIRQTGGILQFAADRAYCAQYAWIQNASVRDNITFGKPFNQQLYSDVVHACALLPDFKLLPHGDMTEIGTHIFNEVICGLLKDKCRSLATHHLHLLSRLDRIIWMVDRRIEAIDTYEELAESRPAFASKKGDSVGLDNTTTKAEVLMQEEAKIVDSVPFSVYVSWLRTSGSQWNDLAMVVGQLLFRSSSILGGLCLSWWVDNKYGLTRGQNCSRLRSFYLVCIKSSQVMSKNALWQAPRAPMSFFDTTSLGRIIYRFTIDIDALDNNLVVAVQQLLINVAALLGSYTLIVAYFYY
ncbi:hypothetical protein QL093DRAFT_2098630 [Fusarium oxysporum]|nr:hypothetical protein QL093DRAFT_2098630 [Fusarium oxysporum]